MRLRKKERQRQLQHVLKQNPFMTDEDLAEHFTVSVQTIRLDRLECGIPELRERMKDVATRNFEDEVKSIPTEEVIGDIIEIELDKTAISIFDVTEEHVFQRNQIARGHHLFAQANSLAVAVLNDDLALTVRSSIHFVVPVRAGDRVIARATVREERTKEKRTIVDIESTVERKVVFRGTFEMYRTTKKEERDE
ncbi:transcription factor FapR [Planococcaceae bacterium Storch 2/2-2]|nr:transcription factor FapR [Planococcaceae bacterium Storch 2/2-2]